MAYFAPYIDSAGLHLASYQDIDEYLLARYASIYGQSLTSNIAASDVQSIAIFALMINDAFQASQLAWNGFMAQAAIGAQQDTLYKINGISRNQATYSTATVTIVGTPFVTLTNRIAQDTNGNLWALPTSFTIPTGGSLTVTATCLTPGAINAAIGAISIMNNPTADWTSVNNAAAATPGIPVESDSAFRGRQSLSVALPSRSLVVGTLAGIAATSGVTRYGTIGVENPTGAVDSYGNPAHSISMVVEGGADLDVATAIYNNKTPGCLTNGTTSVNVTDPVTGAIMPIAFFRPTDVPIYIAISVHPLTGYTTATGTAITNALVTYLNSLQIGEEVTISALYAAAMAVMPNIQTPQFSITALKAGTAPTPTGTIDIPINFNQVAQGNSANITLTIV